MTKQNEEIHKALGILMEACGYKGESGTEWFHDALCEAIAEVERNWHVVERSHKDGLCYDVTFLWADALEKAVIKAGPQT